MEARVTQVSGEAPDISIGFELDMSYLDELAATYNKDERPPDSFTVKEFAKKIEKSDSSAGRILLKLWQEELIERKRVGNKYYYYEVQNASD